VQSHCLLNCNMLHLVMHITHVARLTYWLWRQGCWLDIRGSVGRFAWEASRCHLHNTDPQDSLLFIGQKMRFLRSWSSQGLRPTVHLYSLPSLRKCGAKPPLPLRVFSV